MFDAAFNFISVIGLGQLTLLITYLGFISTQQGLLSVLPMDAPTKNPVGPARIECGTSRSRVLQVATEPCRILLSFYAALLLDCGQIVFALPGCLSVCLYANKLTLAINFRMVSDRAFIFHGCMPCEGQGQI